MIAEIEQAVLAEREACAAIADELGQPGFSDSWMARQVASRIRDRTRQADLARRYSKGATHDQ